VCVTEAVVGGPMISKRSGVGIKLRPYACLCRCTAALKRIIPRDSRGYWQNEASEGPGCGPKDLQGDNQ